MGPGRRILRLLLFLIVGLGGVAALTVQETLSLDSSVRVPPFHAEAFARYDLHVRPAEGNGYVVPGYIEVRSASGVPLALPNGDRVDSLAVAFLQRDASLPVTDPQGHLGDRTVVSYIDSGNGQLLAERNGLDYERNDERPLVAGVGTGNPAQRVLYDFTWWGGVEIPELFLLGANPALTHVLEGRAWHRGASTLFGLEPTETAPLRGVVDGRPVLGVNLPEEARTLRRDLPCPLPLVQRAVVVASGVLYEPANVTGRAWFDGETIYPQLVDCTATFDDGAVLQASARRVEVSEAGPEVQLHALGPVPRMLSKEGRRVAAADVTSDGDGLLYPAHEADAALRADESLLGLQQLLAGSKCVRLARAIYDVPATVPGPSGPIRQAAGPLLGQAGSPTAAPKWTFRYVNERNDAVAASSSRTQTSSVTGDVINSELPPSWEAEDRSWLCDLPGLFFPPDVVLDWAAKDAGIFFRPESGWHMVLEARRSTVLGGAPTYVYKVTEVNLEEGIDVEYGWDASDGALLWNRTTETAPESVPVEPAAFAGPGLTVVQDDFQSLVPASAAAVGLVVLAMYLWKPAKGLLGAALIGLYAKIPADRLLRHPRRSQMVDVVRADPGLSLSEARQRLGLRWGPLLHHLSALEAHRFVVTVKLGKERCLFVPGTYNHSDLAAVALLRNESARRVWETALADPGQSPQELAARLGLSRATVHFHARRLEAAGLLELRIQGRTHRYVARPAPRPAT